MPEKPTRVGDLIKARWVCEQAHQQMKLFMPGGGQGEPCLTDAAPRGRLRHAVRG